MLEVINVDRISGLSPNAAASSLRVSRAPGAPSSTAVTAAAEAVLIIDCWLVCSM